MNVFNDKVFGNGKNYVYYKRLETDTHFKSPQMIFAKAQATTEKYKSIIDSLDLNIVTLLRNQAAAEKQKEINVMKKIAPNVNYESMSPIDLINQLNELIGLRGQYENYLKYLNNWYYNTSAKNMSPVVTSYMSSKIASLVNEYYSDDFAKAVSKIVVTNGDETQIKEMAEEFADRIIQDFIADTNNMTTELLTKMSDVNYTLGEEEKVWKDLLEQINSDAESKNFFITDVMRRFGLKEKIINAYNLTRNEKISKKDRTPKGAMRKAITATAAQQGGFIYETITSLMQGFAVGSGISTSRISDKGTTDLLTVKVDFQYDNLVRQKVNELEGNTRDKADAVKKMTEFSEFLKNNINDGFIIYGNAKSYRLDRLSDMEGYFDGGIRNIKQLPQVMSQYNIPISEDTVELVINTIPGAILENNTTVQNFLSKALAGQVARLLFDDWTTIGDTSGGFDAIHVFNLSGITVPLSYLLEEMADAAEATQEELIGHPTAYVEVKFKLPEKIRFETPSQTTAFIKALKRVPKKEGEQRESYLQQAWDEQKRLALSSSFGINFLSNFNTLLGQLMDSFNIR